MSDAAFLLRHLEWLGYATEACIASDGLVMTAAKNGETWLVKSVNPYDAYEAAVLLSERVGIDLDDG